jgi:T5orf172 domain
MTKHVIQQLGYVYILTNPVIPEFVKIGKTTLDPYARAKQLSAPTGVPAPYTVAWTAFVADCGMVERMAHTQLQSARLRNNKEFFRLPLEVAIDAVRRIAEPYAMAPTAQTAAEAMAHPCAPQPATSPKPQPAEPVTFYSVEAHTAQDMAPWLNAEKSAVLAQLRDVVLRVVPDCLWRMRGDRKITFTPLIHKDRLRSRNLMTVHLQESPVGYRIGKVVQKFSADQLPDIEHALKCLLAERH